MARLSRKNHKHRRSACKMRRSTRRMRQRSQTRSQKRHTRKRGGAPLDYSLAGDWSSKMSMGQGGDYMKYHQGQHGGNLSGAPLSELGQTLPMGLRGPAHISGLDGAFQQIAGLKDQAGGKRRKQRRTRRGGALGYSPFGSPAMLLNATGYQQAGLSPQWRMGAEFDAAKMRESM